MGVKLLLGTVLFVFSLGCGTGDEPFLHADSVVVLSGPARFTAVNGSGVDLPAGPVAIARGEGNLIRVLPEGGDRVLDLVAHRIEHTHSAPEPQAFFLEGENGVAHLVLLVGDYALDAIGGAGGEPLTPLELQMAWTRSATGELVAFSGGAALAGEIAGDLDSFEPAFSAVGDLIDVAYALPDRDREELRAMLAAEEERFRTRADEVSTFSAGSHPPAWAALKEMTGFVGRSRSRIDEPRVYLGDPDRFDRPATVDLDAIYAEIPEYREIRSRGLGRDDARYTFLLLKSSRRFLRALERIAERDGYDLIAGQGAIRTEHEVPDVTAGVIGLLGD